MRPSGTEPKIKLYIYSKDKDDEKALSKVSLIEKTVTEKMYSVE
ncbi:MAG: hypothetical protein ACOXZT_07350 [Tissierellaceae bacterium]